MASLGLNELISLYYKNKSAKWTYIYTEYIFDNISAKCIQQDKNIVQKM